MRLERFATECDVLSAALVDAGAPPSLGPLRDAVARLKAVRDGVPLDDRNLNGSALFSKDRLRATIPLQREATRLLRNAVALRPYTADTDGALTWLAAHRMRLFAADVLLRLSEEAV